MLKKQILSLMTLIILSLLPACNDFGSSDMGGMNAGVTPGGVQDNGYVRTLIGQGTIPAPELFTYEGFFSEHDFNIDTPKCTELLCFEPALASIQEEQKETRHFIQLLMGSNIDLSTYQRPATDLMIVLDISGSMYGEPIEQAKEALKEVVKQMKTGDQLGIITFNNQYSVLHQFQGIPENTESIINKINQIEADGGTDIETPLRAAYEMIAQGQNSNKRVVLITDARPNINGTGENDFTTLIQDYENSVGITVFGVGYDLGFDLAKIISETAGGNYIYLETGEALLTRIQEDFPLLIAPLATNFEVRLSRGAQFDIVNSYGLPEIEGEDITLQAKSLFLSKTKGAMAIELSYDPTSSDQIVPMQNDKMLNIQWHYDLNGETIKGNKLISFIPPTQNSSIYYHRLDGAEKITILIDIIETFKNVTKLYQSENQEDAKALLSQKIKHFKTVLGEYDDEQLNQELVMMEQLHSNMSDSQN